MLLLKKKKKKKSDCEMSLRPHIFDFQTHSLSKILIYSAVQLRFHETFGVLPFPPKLNTNRTNLSSGTAKILF